MTEALDSSNVDAGKTGNGSPPHLPRAAAASSMAPGLMPSAGTPDEILHAVGIALYLTDADGRIVFYNDAAVDLWGRRPEADERWCGSLHLYRLDGRPLPHSECPMARTVQRGEAVRG